MSSIWPVLYDTCLSFLVSLSVAGPNWHAGGSGDIVRASAVEETKEDILPQEREIRRPAYNHGT